MCQIDNSRNRSVFLSDSLYTEKWLLRNLRSFSSFFLPSSFSFFLSFFFFYPFCGCTQGIGKFPGQGLNQSYRCWPIPRPQQQLEPICVCNLHHSSQKCPIPDPWSKARDQMCILMDSSQICFCCAMKRTPTLLYFFKKLQPIYLGRVISGGF